MIYLVFLNTFISGEYFIASIKKLDLCRESSLVNLTELARRTSTDEASITDLRKVCCGAERRTGTNS